MKVKRSIINFRDMIYYTALLVKSHKTIITLYTEHKNINITELISYK